MTLTKRKPLRSLNKWQKSLRFSDWNFSLSDLSGLSFPLHIDSPLGRPHLNMGLRWEIWTDSTVSSVSSSSTLSGSINGDVINCEVFKILGVGVWFKVINEAEHNSDWFFRPSTEGLAEFGSLSGSTDSTEMLKIRFRQCYFWKTWS